jgi:hypothetical protein
MLKSNSTALYKRRKDMKIEDKVIKLLKKGKYAKAKDILLFNHDKVNAKALYEKFEEKNLLDKYECVKVLSGYLDYGSQLDNDFKLFYSIYENSYLLDIGKLLDKGANPNYKFEVEYFDENKIFTCIDLLKDAPKDRLFIFMEKGCDMDPEKFFDRYNCNSPSKNYSFVKSYEAAKIDLRPVNPIEYRFNSISLIPVDETIYSREAYNKLHAVEFTEEQIKEFAQFARWGIFRQLKNARDNNRNDDKTLKTIEELNKQIDAEETEYLGILQEKAKEEVRRAEAEANYQRTEDLISDIEDKIDEM